MMTSLDRTSKIDCEDAAAFAAFAPKGTLLSNFDASLARIQSREIRDLRALLDATPVGLNAAALQLCKAAETAVSQIEGDKAAGILNSSQVGAVIDAVRGLIRTAREVTA